MEEPNRIGLTAATSAQLDELLEELNPESGTEGVKLIKFDLYRFAVALGLKKGTAPAPLTDKSSASFRVTELDPDDVLYLSVEYSDLLPAGCTIYEFVERLAEVGIREFYDTYQQSGELPLDEYLTE
jgi:hypothetical protein